MTRKDFVLIARVLSENTDHTAIVCRFAQELAKVNPRFDTERFIKACGLEQDNQAQ